MSKSPDGPDAGLFTVPNLVSVARLGCVPVFLWLLFGLDAPLGAAVLLAFLGATDWVDGYIARRFGQVSEIGKILDPTADRIMLLVAVLAIAVAGHVPWWFAGLTLAREGLVSVMAVILGALGARRIDVTWWGKTGTFLLMISFPLFLASGAEWDLADPSWWLAWACGAPGLVIAYYAAWGYLPAARSALAEGRAARRGQPS
ncbi:MAG: CDP-alcohol phosphatidyltransferase family protein [Acidimicrobiales bacterium]